MKKIKKPFILIIVFLIGIYSMACALIYMGQEQMIFHPYKLDKDHVYRFNKDVVEKDLITQNKDTINTIRFEVDSSKGVVLFLHGNTGNLQVCGYLNNRFTALGYDFFMYDYQGFGKSSGQVDSKHILKNAQVVYDHLKSIYKEKSIIIYGQSIGTGMAAFLAANNNPRELILEAPYYNFKFLADMHMPYFPTSLLLRYRLKTNEFVKKTKCPVTIFHGTNDRTIPYLNAKKLAQLSDLNLVRIEGGGHNDLSRFPVYAKAISEILR